MDEKKSKKKQVMGDDEVLHERKGKGKGKRKQDQMDDGSESKAIASSKDVTSSEEIDEQMEMICGDNIEDEQIEKELAVDHQPQVKKDMEYKNKYAKIAAEYPEGVGFPFYEAIQLVPVSERSSLEMKWKETGKLLLKSYWMRASLIKEILSEVSPLPFEH